MVNKPKNITDVDEYRSCIGLHANRESIIIDIFDSGMTIQQWL